MEADIRTTALFAEAEALYARLYRAGSDSFFDAADISWSGADGQFAITASIAYSLSESPRTRICRVDCATGSLTAITQGPRHDRHPRFSPCGRLLAFLSDREQAGDFQLHIIDGDGTTRAAPRVDGWIEYLHWSPDGATILLGVAGHGADLSGSQGAVSTRRAAADHPTWIPEVETGHRNFQWRSAWLYDVAQQTVRRVGPAGLNIWEAGWAGPDALVAIASDAPDEGSWYSAAIYRIAFDRDEAALLFRPQAQLGLSKGAPDGSVVAFVEAVCSDRLVIAGDLLLVSTANREVTRVATNGIDVTSLEWLDADRILIAGHRGFETVVAMVEVASLEVSELWESDSIAGVGRYTNVVPLGTGGDFALIAEGFTRPPEVAEVRGGVYRTVRSMNDGRAVSQLIDQVHRCSWAAPDGLAIEGWLLAPQGAPPFPLVMVIHGGPVWHWHPHWLGRSSIAQLMLLERGCAIFLPNPRGSGGRGQDFAGRVVGDIGGADTQDYLCGIDHLVELGLADEVRLGVTGGSYGGYMTSWLVTQTERFAAAIALAPATNKVSQHLISNIPQYTALFMADSYANLGGKYYQRSPISYAHRVKTPTLNICGKLDRCTPPGEAVQFHHALVENGVESALVTYPEEGHGIRGFPAAIDYAARVVDWFCRHLLSEPGQQ